MQHHTLCILASLCGAVNKLMASDCGPAHPHFLRSIVGIPGQAQTDAAKGPTPVSCSIRCARLLHHCGGPYKQALGFSAERSGRRGGLPGPAGAPDADCGPQEAGLPWGARSGPGQCGRTLRFTWPQTLSSSHFVLVCLPALQATTLLSTEWSTFNLQCGISKMVIELRHRGEAGLQASSLAKTYYRPPGTGNKPTPTNTALQCTASEAGLLDLMQIRHWLACNISLCPATASLTAGTMCSTS